MVVTKLFIIGNLTVPSSWIALITAFIVAFVALRLRYGKQLSSLLADAIFYFILVWKLSVIVTDFKTVIKLPLSILYFNGGQIGFYIGLLVAMAFILIECKKKEVHRLERMGLFGASVLIQAIYQVMMVLLNEGHIVAQSMTIAMFIIFSLYIWLSIGKADHSFPQVAILFIAVHLFTAAFQPQGIFGTAVFATILISLFFIMMLRKSSKK